MSDISWLLMLISCLFAHYCHVLVGVTRRILVLQQELVTTSTKCKSL
ncbi:hypothetical protein SynPROS91_01462 [Synechococcus sp. PROS-9-1]|nr:hypothetical protein SynPROS91_01462 [Synechococcus sp. PROS-9-1]